MHPSTLGQPERRRGLLIAASALLLTALAGCTQSTKVADSRPNVIIVLTDDQGYGDMSAHGNPILRTPHLDRLHDESVRLTDFHVAPVCTPDAGRTHDGPLRPPQQGRHGAGGQKPHAARHSDDAGDLSGKRLRDRAVRKVAPRGHLPAPAAGQGIRPLRLAQGLGLRFRNRVRQRLLLHPLHRSGRDPLLGPLLHGDLVRRGDGMDGRTGRRRPAVLHLPGAQHPALPLQRPGEALLSLRQPGGRPPAGPLSRPDRHH